MQIFTQNWLSRATNYLNSFSTRCSNGRSTDYLCLESNRYQNLARMVDDFGSTHRRLQSKFRDAWDSRTTWQSRCLICEPDSLKRGAIFSTRVRYLGPPACTASGDYTQFAYYKEAFECSSPIDLSPAQHEETEFGAPEMTQSWKNAGWNPPICEWTAEHCKVPRFANVTQANDAGIQFECPDDVCRDRNSLETGADCTLIAAEKINLDAPFTRPEIPRGILPLVSRGEIKEPWTLTVGAVSALAFAVLTYRAIRNYRLAVRMQPDSVSSKPPSLRPAWTYAAIATASAVATFFEYQNLTRIYSATFL